MEKYPVRQNDISTGERISLSEYYRKRKRFFALFLICAAFLVAAFALSSIFEKGSSLQNGTAMTDGIQGSNVSTESTFLQTDTEKESMQTTVLTETELREPTKDPIGGTPVLTLTLPTKGSGNAHINNESIQVTAPRGYLDWDVSCKIGNEPLVLILHTHTSEGYLEEAQEWIQGEVGEVTYTEDATRNVLAVGEILCDVLNEEGIPSIHCTTVHDGDGRMGAYERAAESVRFFLSHYPGITYVVDLHRDAILTSDGKYVRAIAGAENEALAQVMAVVGSDGNGTHHPNWERNLAIAEQLRAALNEKAEDLCRPTVLRNASYNQELAPYSLLLEIGTGGNCIEEAKRSAALVGRALADLIRGA